VLLEWIEAALTFAHDCIQSQDKRLQFLLSHLSSSDFHLQASNPDGLRQSVSLSA